MTEIIHDPKPKNVEKLEYYWVHFDGRTIMTHYYEWYDELNNIQRNEFQTEEVGIPIEDVDWCKHVPEPEVEDNV